MTMTAPAAEAQTFTITEQIAVRATVEQTFASLIAQMGRLNETPDGRPLPMIDSRSSHSVVHGVNL